MSEKKKKVFILDDDQEILGILRFELKIHKLDSFETPKIEDTLDKLKDERFDCIVLDIFIGQESSNHVIEFLKSEENQVNKGVPIILMSGGINVDFIERNRDKVYAIVEKPFSSKEIVDKIIESISNS